MRNLLVIALVLVSVTAQAKNKKMTESYKKAKEACMTENKDLKGKALKECIATKEKAEAPAAEAKTEAPKTETAAPAHK